jgi:peptidoglycan hydrolase-like protein with peptidoglycan-binding domain
MTTQLEAPEEPLGRPRIRRIYIVATLVAIPLIAAAVAAAAIASSKGSIRGGSGALAVIAMPRGGARVVRVVAVGGPQQQVIAVRISGDRVLPVGQLAQGERISIDVTLRRPGWISWLSGSTEHLSLTVVTPVARLRSAFLTRRPGTPLTVRFSAPVVRAGYGPQGAPVTVGTLSAPQTSLALSERASAGAARVGFAPRAWERPTLETVSWFPAGSGATAISTPAAGATIKPDTKITLTFSKPVAKALGTSLPQISPQTAGGWRTLNARTIEFVPQGYGYGLAATVKLALPATVKLMGGQAQGSSTVAQWTVPGGSTLGLQRLLSKLGYLPVAYQPARAAATTANSPEAEEAIAVDPPAGRFTWRYPHTPRLLKALWSPTTFTEITKGAVMAFQQAQGLTPDGVAGPSVWKALIDAAVKNQASTFGYTFVMVSEKPPETIRVWHSGRIVVHGLANTGIPVSPTATGTYAVYEHMASGTMSGKNPDGSTYHDTGIPWISYFNGGDALHGFIRSSYGSQQSLGCVEMPFAEAGAVYPYTPVGTIVNVTPA